MIDIAVFGLIGANRDDHLVQAGVGGELPVIDRQLWGRNVGIGALIDPGQILGVTTVRLNSE